LTQKRSIGKRRQFRVSRERPRLPC
jgi:hypothetical protein